MESESILYFYLYSIIITLIRYISMIRYLLLSCGNHIFIFQIKTKKESIYNFELIVNKSQF